MKNYYDVFYWLSVSDGVKHFFDVVSNIFTAGAILSFMALVICIVFKSGVAMGSDEEDKKSPTVRSWELGRKYFTRLFYTFLPLAIICWMGFVFTPTKKDCLMIVAGGAIGNFIQSDSSSKALPSDVTKFLP